MDRELTILVAEITELLSRNDTSGLRECLTRLHPSDLAEVIEELDPEQGARLLGLMDEEGAAETLDDLESQTQREVLAGLTAPKIAGILEQMADDDIADLVAELGSEQAEQVLGLLEYDDRQDVRQLMSYPEDTAGGIMTTEFVSVSAGYTAAQAIEHLRRLAPDAETINYIYVLDVDGQLCGVVSLRELILADPGTRIREFMETDLIVAKVTEDQEEVARSAMHYDLLAVPVIDDKGTMLGIVTIDDLIDVIDEEAAEDFYGVAHGGPVPDEAVAAQQGVWFRVKLRLPWLILLMFGDFLSANVISGFSHVLESVVALAFFIPVLMDMGGNVGTQSLAMTVRGMATGEIDHSDMLRLVLREVRVGASLGIICGALIALVGLVWQGSAVLGLVVGVSMFATMSLAAILGTLVPMIMDRLGVDSAVASSPFITSMVDVAGLSVYFAVAKMVLESL